MASATEEKEKQMAADEVEEGGEKRTAPAPKDEGGGFFHIYKKGQGKWTRLCTAGAAALITALTVNFLYHQMPVWLRAIFDNSEKITDPVAKAAAAAQAVSTANNVTVLFCTAFVLGVALLVFWLMNKPANADFMIATDSEMKKVNWTSRKELIGSTKVVIIFMFLIASLLFGFDIIFGYLFYFIGVLQTKPI